MFVKPAPGRAPRCPYTFMRIPTEGQAYADHDPHIALYLRCGDLVEAKAPEPPDGEVKPFEFPPEPPDSAPPAAAESTPAAPAADPDASHTEEGR